MRFVKGNLIVQCEGCNQNNVILAKNSNFVQSFKIERIYGFEKTYSWEQLVNCSCGQVNKISYKVWEYPEGVLMDDNIQIVGGQLISNFVFDFTLD